MLSLFALYKDPYLGQFGVYAVFIPWYPNLALFGITHWLHSELIQGFLPASRQEMLVWLLQELPGVIIRKAAPMLPTL